MSDEDHTEHQDQQEDQVSRRPGRGNNPSATEQGALPSHPERATQPFLVTPTTTSDFNTLGAPCRKRFFGPRGPPRACRFDPKLKYRISRIFTTEQAAVAAVPAQPGFQPRSGSRPFRAEEASPRNQRFQTCLPCRRG